MRFLPLLSSFQAPGAWKSFQNVELAWESGLHPGWGTAVRTGVGFLVIPARAPRGRAETSRFLGYRWNMAIPAEDPATTARIIANLEETHPMIYFPKVTP